MYLAHIWGDLDIASGGVAGLLPPRTKDKAVLATLLVSPEMRRSRKWLQAILWGDAEPDNAATSLRQTLTRLRRVFQGEEQVLCADRHSVWLTPGKIQVAPRTTADQVLFEGLDVGEEAFEDWLLEQRQALDRAHPAPDVVTSARFVQGLIAPSAPAPSARVRISLVAGIGSMPNDPEVHRLIGRARDRLHALEIFDIGEAATAALAPEGIALRLERPHPSMATAVFLTNGGRDILYTLTEPEFQEDPNAPAAFVDRIFEVLLSLTDGSTTDDAQAVAAQMDMRQVFEGLFIPGSHASSDLMTRVDRAFDMGQSGVLFGLRNAVRMLCYGERLNGHDAIPMDQVLADIRASLWHSPDNGLVHCLAAHCYSLFVRDHSAALDHGRLAVRAAPDSALCWAILALAHLRAQDVKGALGPAQTANAIGQMSRYRPFYDGVSAASHAAAQDFDTALKHAQRSLRQAPDFSSARQLMFLASERTGKASNAETIAASLIQSGQNFGREGITSDISPVNIELLRPAMAESAARLGFH
ncbi:hypothetical protein JANAI61_27990 [Jannaschia sp. AI_61]|uniref:hypothetical protein n=1 Tax=Jannaschia sp. AI_61 TaxID=2829796 RepID=UPI001BC000F4|nr:hypothetical protein [Jannaschia sp. AI_61]GIT92341.1 hypothetical protein JANAI61_27990 [Jannaschia sp. AI_61]